MSSSALAVLVGLLMLAVSGCSALPAVSTTVVVEWDRDHLTIEKHVEDSDIIAVGEIVEIDPPRWNSPDGEQWRPREEQTLAVLYTTFYVEPTALLKGTSEWGTPIAFRIQNGVVGGDADLSVGERVVAFGASDGRYGPGAVYQPAGAYWLTNGNNSIWIQKGGIGVYRNQGYTKDPGEASLSLEELEARIAALTSSNEEVSPTTTPSSTQPTTSPSDEGTTLVLPAVPTQDSIPSRLVPRPSSV
ncbi:MAG: hypothetical protein V1912_03610 [bacterium]